MYSVLTRWQLERIANYDYEAENRTLLDPILQVYWRWLLEKLPLWLAPNVLTASGLLINVFTFLLVMWYSPHAKEEVPPWVFVLCAVGVFVYQTLDALDGKQFYRTGRGDSPLEELTDHGADSISTVLLLLQISAAWQLGNNPSWMLFFCLTSMVLFYCFHWQVFVTRVVRFGKIDVTEIQVCTCVVFLLTAKYGSSIWMTKVPFLDLPLREVALWGQAGGLAYGFVSLFVHVCQFRSKTGSSTTWQGYNVMLPLPSIAAAHAMAYALATTSSSNLFHNHPCLFVLTFGLVVSKLIIKLVISCLAKGPAEMTDVLLAVGGLQILNVQLGSWIDECSLLCVMLVWVLFDLLRYGWFICNDICDFCNLGFFTLDPRRKSDETRNGHVTAMPSKTD